jgi:hypothetical protein
MGAKRTAKKAAAKKAATTGAPPLPALSPDEVAARIAATGLVTTAYLLPWESIHGPGDYAAIARAFRDLAGDDLPLEAVSDTVDLPKKHAAIELSLDGVHHVIEAEVRGSRVDDGVLVMLAGLLDLRQEKRPGATRRRLFVDASSCRAAKTYAFLCATPEATAAVNAATGAAFVAVSEL